MGNSNTQYLRQLKSYLRGDKKRIYIKRYYQYIFLYYEEKNIPSSLELTKTNLFRTDLPKMVRHTEGTLFIYSPKHRKDNQLQSLKHNCRISQVCFKHNTREFHTKRVNSGVPKRRSEGRNMIEMCVIADTLVQYIYVVSIISKFWYRSMK